jgi:hypothetical protein
MQPKRSFFAWVENVTTAVDLYAPLEQVTKNIASGRLFRLKVVTNLKHLKELINFQLWRAIWATYPIAGGCAL